MNNLPIKASDNLLSRIKKIIIKLFKKENRIIYQEEKELLDNEKEFKKSINVKIEEKDAIEKINMQKRKNDLLEKFAKNTEMLNYLSMDELVQLEKMYEEELERMTINA